MAQKITLSIPDMLHERLKEWRDSFNFSKMFQDAVTDAIQKKEEFQKRFSQEFDMSEVVKRLQKEKQAWVRQFYRLGRKEGEKWGKSAHFEDLLYVLHIPDTYELVQDSRLKDYFDNTMGKYGVDRFTIGGSADHKKMFLDGWINGVKEFWNQVKESL
ncbi:MAG: hypothetical protein K9K40_01875 [Desulfotignum sp.]|nr:hypothetical protein [Desulfotignum sp.]